MRNKTVNLKKMMRFFILLLFVAVCFFTYDYYSVSNLNSLGEELIKFEYDSENNTVAIHSDYDVPLITSIRYTTDGSIPTKNSAEYDEPLIIENEGRSGTVIRAAIFRGGKYTDVYTKTFFSSPSALNDGIYTVCISTDADNLYSDEKGIFALGAATQEEANANENIPQGPAGYISDRANYFGSGIEWERPATVEIYTSDGEHLITKDVGMRVSGATTRRLPVKSLRLYARKAYDGTGVFELDIFNQYTESLGNQVTTFNHLDLRNGGNNFYYTMLPDSVMRQLAYDGGMSTVGTSLPAAVYINGEYYGLMWMQSDYCGRNIAEMTGLDNNAVIRTIKGFEGSATDGTMEGYLDYKEMYEYATAADFTIAEERAKLERLVDMDDFFAYYFLQMYCDNNDWPTNNYGLWRCIDPAGSDPDNKYADGRWRFILYDLDNAFSSYTDDTEGFDFILGNKLSPMFINVMRSAEYRQRFVNVVCDFMSTSTKTENAYNTYLYFKELIAPEMEWRSENNAPIDFDDDFTEIAHLRISYHIQTKQGIIDQRLRDYFGARQKYSLTVTDIPENATVKLNTLEFTQGDEFTGAYYKDIPASLTYAAGDGYTLDYWLINGVKYYDKELVLDETVTGSGDCTVEIYLKQISSQPKLKSFVWGGIARYTDVYNPGIELVSLEGWYISADEYGTESYAIPAVTLQPGESFRIYFTDDKSASVGDYICGINVKERMTVYLVKDGQYSDKVYVPEYIEGNYLEKSVCDGSWKYSLAEEGTL